MNTRLLFPTVDKADEILREKCIKGMMQKFSEKPGILVEKALEKELEIIRQQGTASGYITVLQAFEAVSLPEDKLCCRGTMASSLVAYLLGFSDFNPLDSLPALYSEFYFGLDGQKLPAFEFTVSSGLHQRLLAYFNGHIGKDDFVIKYDAPNNPYGIKLMCADEMDGDQVFNFNFSPVRDEAEFKQSLLPDDIVSLLRPKNLSDYVKCFGLYHGTGTWTDNAENLINTGLASLDEIIADREDVYEYLSEKGIDERSAYDIAEYVRKGCVNRKGWTPDMYKLLKVHGVPDWYVESCERILYLFPRAHAVALYRSYCKDTFESAII